MSWEDILKNDDAREMAELMWKKYPELKEKAKSFSNVNARNTIRDWENAGLPHNPNKEQFIQWYIEFNNQPIEKVPFTPHPAWDVYEY